jgi:hypothetical protein
MKKSLSILLALFLVVGAAGAALAAFDPGNMFFVAYEEDESVIVTGINDQPGLESFFDLGATTSFVTAIQAGNTIDTNITLAVFNTGSWDDVFVATFGQLGGGLGDTSAVFSSDDPNYSYNALNFGFDTGYKNLATALTTGPNVVVDKAALSGTYKKEMQATGNEPGTYAGPVTAGTTFGAELNLAGIGANPADWISLSIFGGDTFADLIDPDGDFRGQLPLLANISLGLDAADGSLVINPVPVPAAVWMLGSGLLALIGIRRRKMK